MVETDRRRTPRYSFTATAEVASEGSNTSVSAKVSELSLNGCYLDMENPFPLSTKINVKISAERETVQSKGRIIYLHPGIGAGVVFFDVTPESQKILQRWLATAEGETLHS